MFAADINVRRTWPQVISRTVSAVFILIFATLCGCATPLDRAISAGDLDAAKIAIDQGANVVSTYSVSPIHEAVHHGDVAMINLLRANGAQLDKCYLDTEYPGFWSLAQSDYYHDSLPPMGSAIARNDVKAVEALIDLGAPAE